MKKMTILAALVAAVTLTAYSVSGTYAKYASDFSDTSTARVAKWGVKGEVNKANLFLASYNEGAVASENGADLVIAPGTEGSYSFVMSGAPEVAFKLDVTKAVVTDGTNGQVKFYFDDEDKATPLTATELENKIKGLAKEYPANDDTFAGTHTIAWAWPFETDPNSDTTDSGLGNLDTLPTLTLEVVMHAEQLANAPASAAPTPETTPEATPDEGA